ncbi:Gfo/Idh/MocA family oxidoreductase [Niveibacterium sp. SC-1]|uniref:Gfo/Idh/MocA family protein n=1 Tax=Niveibacterium sp. SC-1 TaxID=3135646 RepID=UPI00311F47EB
MSTIKIGLIGAGMYGKVLIRAFRHDGRAEIKWVCSASEKTSRATAEECGVPHWTLDYREILADPEVDAVAIATPVFLHTQPLIDALAAGKHVLIEKPMAESRANVARILDAVAAAPDRVVLEASCRHTRMTAKFRAVKGLIDSGRLGEVYHIHHVSLTPRTFIEWNPGGAWAMDKSRGGGGPFMDWGVYDLSFHLGLLDDKPQLTGLRAFTRNGLRDIGHLVPFADVEQHGAAWLDFDTGLTYYYERGAGVHGETTCETRIQGTKGSVRLQYPSWDSPQIEFFSAVDGEPRRELLEVTEPEAEDANPLARHFIDCIEGRAQPMMPVSRAAKHLDILFRILEA